MKELETFLQNPYVTFVPVTWTTADRFSRVAVELKHKGTPIPTNDLWVAAHAMETGADLISFDEHFKNVDGLAWIHPEELAELEISVIHNSAALLLPARRNSLSRFSSLAYLIAGAIEPGHDGEQGK